MKNKFLNSVITFIFAANTLYAEPENVKVVQGILVSTNETKQILVAGTPVAPADTRPVLKGILVRPPEPLYRETVYYEESDPVVDVLIGTTVFLGLAALFCAPFGHHHRYHHRGYHYRGYHHGHRHGGYRRR